MRLLRLFAPEELLQDLAVGREKQAILATADRVRRLNHVEKARDRDADFFQPEDAPLVPDRLDIESLDDERQIDRGPGPLARVWARLSTTRSASHRSRGISSGSRSLQTPHRRRSESTSPVPPPRRGRERAWDARPEF